MKLEVENLMNEDSIKLIKNSKGYGWELKVYGKNVLEEIIKLNKEMLKEFKNEIDKTCDEVMKIGLSSGNKIIGGDVYCDGTSLVLERKT